MDEIGAIQIDQQIGRSSTMICRACLNTDILDLQELFADNIPDLYRSLTSISISFDDGLPIAICKQCKENLENFYLFKNKCINAQHLLETHLENTDFKFNIESVVKIEIEDITTHEYECDEIQENVVKEIEPNEITIKAEKSEENINDGKRLVCTICKRIFKRLCALQQHMQTHNNPNKVFDCDICSKRYDKINRLKRHMVIWHTNRERSFCCDICKSTFMGKDVLYKHMNVHVQLRPFKCSECSQSFAREPSLIKHTKTHIEGRKFLCPFCAKRFKVEKELQYHVFLHTGERPFVCQMCTKGFSRPDSLKRHIDMTHERINTIEQCTVCAKTFNHRINLRVHMKNMHMKNKTPQKQHSCDICYKMFNGRSRMTKHRKTHTNNK